MSEVSLQSSPYDYRQWLGVDELGLARIVDYETGVPVDPNVVPGLIMADPELCEGVEYLENGQQNTPWRLRVVLGPHREPRDVDTGQSPGTFARRVVGSAACLYEAGDWTMEWHDAVVRAIQEGRPLPPGSHPFLVSIIQVATEAGVFCNSFDVHPPLSFRPKPGDAGYAEAAVLSIQGQWEYPFRKKDPQLFAVWNYLREWVMVARIGLLLKRLEAPAVQPSRWQRIGSVLLRKKPEPNVPAKEVILPLGTAHRDVVRKLGLFSVAVEPELQAPDKYKDTASMAGMLHLALRTGDLSYMPA